MKTPNLFFWCGGGCQFVASTCWDFFFVFTNKTHFLHMLLSTRLYFFFFFKSLDAEDIIHTQKDITFAPHFWQDRIFKEQFENEILWTNHFFLTPKHAKTCKFSDRIDINQFSSLKYHLWNKSTTRYNKALFID